MVINNVILNSNITQLEYYQEEVISVDSVDIGQKDAYWRCGRGRKKKETAIDLVGYKNNLMEASLVAQWLRVHLPM